MPKTLPESFLLTSVDSDWYLRTYPDVAAAGVDPQQHYALYGRAEGRLPRPLRSLRLDKALWGGFSRLALPELHTWLQASSDPDEQASAAWALARWYASHGQWREALPLLDFLEGELPPWLHHLGPSLLRVEVLLRNNLRQRAYDHLHEAIARHGQLPDLCLAAANACLSINATEETLPVSDDGLRLLWVNQVLTTAGLVPLGLRDTDRPLSLDNLQALSPFVNETVRSRSKPPKISVIMPAFNAASFIETALRSLQAQTWQNFEVLVVDDCSSDDTCERVTALARGDRRIVLLRQPYNQGAYAARNAALQRAGGDFLVNHDSDDWSHPQRLERMAQPLLRQEYLVATLADWVRTDTALHFQCWRIENRLIEPSVSTLMVRSKAVRQLGGWDEVRVAADHELRQRLLRIYGPDSIGHVLPGTPLVLARQLPESLTMAPATHLRSVFYGLRRLYSELAETWYDMAQTPEDLCLLPPPAQRPFPAPASILRSAPVSIHYDCLLIADLSCVSHTHAANQLQVARLLADGKRVALFHWPDYLCPEPIDPLYLRYAIRGDLDVVLAEQRIEVGDVLVIGRALLSKPLDRMPHLRFRSFRVIDSPLTLKMDFESVPPKLFAADWYLQRYPDVCAAGMNPWQHYLLHGAAEGRDPSPDFNTAHYFAQCPQARESGMPALLHYLRVGRHMGHDAGHPFLTGQQPKRAKHPTLLLCAHAADHQLFGAERCLLDVLDACSALALNVLVSIPSLVNAPYIAALQARSLGVVCIPHMPWQENNTPCPLAVQRFSEFIRSHSVDLVHANTLMLREPLLAARQAGVPAFVHVHESPFHDPDLAAAIGLPADRIVQQVLATADHVLANSAFTARQFTKPGATHIVCNIVDADSFSLPHSLNARDIKAALISSNLPKKGLADLEELARLLAKDTPNLHLLLIGPDNVHVARLRKMLQCGQLPDNLQIVPYAQTPQAALAQTDIVLNLSHCQETFGRTALEGMAAGRPVLAYQQGALPELIEDGISGFLVAPGDVSTLAKRLQELCADPQRILQMGVAGRHTARRYNLALLCKQLAQAYRQVLPLAEINPKFDVFTQKTNNQLDGAII